MFFWMLPPRSMFLQAPILRSFWSVPDTQKRLISAELNVPRNDWFSCHAGCFFATRCAFIVADVGFPSLRFRHYTPARRFNQYHRLLIVSLCLSSFTFFCLSAVSPASLSAAFNVQLLQSRCFSLSSFHMVSLSVIAAFSFPAACRASVIHTSRQCASCDF